jgi:phosphatidylethanolamine/phosphatidyl-N-methylethanolamine N-methyltransferase
MVKKRITSDHGSQSLYYEKFYETINVRGGGIGSRAFQKLHQAMEKPYNKKFFAKVLEIGAGTGEHLEFINHKFDEYILTDIRKPILATPWAVDPKIMCVEANAEDLPFQDRSFDRIICTCLLHHVEKPEKVLTEILRLLKSDGEAMIYLTCDPGLMTRLVRRLTTQRAAERAGYQGFELLMAREHRNHIGSLLSLVKFVFRDRNIRIRYLPFGLPSWNLNGSVIIHVS